MAQGKRIDGQFYPNRGLSISSHFCEIRFLPIGGSRIESQHLASPRPLWLHDLVERGIVEDSQQLRLGRCAVSLPDFHRPFLLLSRLETVAKRLPAHVEFMFPHGC